MMKRLFILALVLFSGAASARPCCEHWGWTGKGAFLKAGAEEVAAVTRSATQLVASVQQQLTTLNKIKVEAVAGQVFGFIDMPDEPVTKDKPKRVLILVLGVIVGLVFGALYALMLLFIHKEND